MNLMYRQLKNVEALLQITRGYAVQKQIPVQWVRPEKVPCIHPSKSGDGGIDFNISPEDYLNKFEHSTELEDADEIVKRMFTIGFNRRKDLVQLRIRKACNLVARHKNDYGSTEIKIAAASTTILQLQEHQAKFPNNSRTKVILKELIEKRNKWLKKLRLMDYPRFEYLLEKLNLKYRPVPEDDPYIYRKDSTRKLLNQYCEKEIKKKLDSYRDELKAQQKQFFEEKAENLEFIRREEIACGINPTVTEEEIKAAKEKAATFV